MESRVNLGPPLILKVKSIYAQRSRLLLTYCLFKKIFFHLSDSLCCRVRCVINYGFTLYDWKCPCRSTVLHFGSECRRRRHCFNRRLWRLPQTSEDSAFKLFSHFLFKPGEQSTAEKTSRLWSVSMILSHRDDFLKQQAACERRFMLIANVLYLQFKNAILKFLIFHSLWCTILLFIGRTLVVVRYR